MEMIKAQPFRVCGAKSEECMGGRTVFSPGKGGFLTGWGAVIRRGDENGPVKTPYFILSKQNGCFNG